MKRFKVGDIFQDNSAPQYYFVIREISQEYVLYNEISIIDGEHTSNIRKLTRSTFMWWTNHQKMNKINDPKTITMLRMIVV